MVVQTPVKSLAEALFSAAPIEAHPLARCLDEGRLPPAQMRLLALQIHHVVDHFPRFLAAILARIPSWRMRMPLVENLFEEHGRMDGAAVHVETYGRFLAGLGISENERVHSRPSVPVLAYNRAVLDLCLHHPFQEGLGALGVIEEIVARMSPLVSRAAARLMDSGPGTLGHFSDHAVLDLAHCDEIYTLAEQVFEGEGAAQVELGMALGMYYHRRLYTDLMALAEAAPC